MYARRLDGSDPTLAGDRTLASESSPSGVYDLEPLSRGDSVGRYLVLRPLGRGGMGEVYAAHDPQLDRTVALKVVRRAGSRGYELRDEAKSLARLSHRNVVSVHDVGELPDGLFIAMEYIEGQTLRAWSRAHRDDVGALARIMRDAGRGLAAAHKRGLVHLDFKPDNVMIAADGRVVVLDFGLAQVLGASAPNADERPAGTPAYMAPEQHRGEALDARTDQFAFCVTWLECAIGQRPFSGDSPAAVTRAILDAEVTLPVRVPKMSRQTLAALRRGIEGEPQARWSSMKALLAATRPAAASARAAWLAVGAAVAVGGGVAWSAASEGSTCARAGSPVTAVWSADASEALRARVLGRGLPMAADDAARITERLDGYANDLAAGYVEACTAASQDGARQACLDTRLEQLRATVDLLTEPADAPETAELFAAMQGVGRCRIADQETVYTEGGSADEARDLLRRLASGRTLAAAGRHEEAAPALASIATEAASAGLGGVESLARVELSARASLRGEAEDARLQLEQAMMLAANAESAEATYRALEEQIAQHSLEGRLEAVEALVPVARAAAARAGLSGAAVEVARGNARQLRGDIDGAEVAYRDALSLTDMPGVRLKAQSNLGALALYRGRYVEARTLFEEALPVSVALHGAGSVATLKMAANLADAHQQLGAFDVARRRYEQTLQTYEVLGSADSQPAEHVRLNLAIALLGAGETEAALKMGREAAARMRAMHGDQHVFAFAARDFVAQTEAAQGREAMALTMTTALRDDMVALLGEEAGIVGFIDLQASKYAGALGQAGAGLEAARAGRRRLQSLAPRHPAIVAASRLASEHALAMNDLETARAEAADALDRAQEPSVPPVERGRARLAQAEVLRAQGQGGAATEQLLRQAAADFRQALGHPDARPSRVQALLDEQATDAP
ncbi:MAG: serine/threonine-protein kinase [Myxococcota bacterium]